MGQEATKWCEQRGERTFAWRAGRREREGRPELALEEKRAGN